MQISFENKNVLVTGGATGIGKAIAGAFAEAGANVMINHFNQAALAEEMTDKGTVSAACDADMSKKPQVTSMMQKIASKHGAIDILVNNAGITRDNLAMRMKAEDWQAVLDVNLTAAFTLIKASMRGMMKSRWGRVINITSVVGVTGNAGQANYAASKAGMIGMSKSLAAEVASRNVTVNCVAPGLIDTEMVGVNVPVEEILKAITARRLGRPEEVAAAVSFLMSPEAAYVTRQVISVNGGLC